MKYIKRLSSSILCLIIIVFIIVLFGTPAHASSKSKIIYKLNTTEKVVAFTFDDGYTYENAVEILDILEENNVKCTFFLMGIFMKKYPDIVSRMIDEGHELGNHSYNHPYFTEISDSEIKNQLSRSDEIIMNITGLKVKPLFRPPFGSFDQHVLEVIGNEGYQYTIYWTIDTEDWKGHSAPIIIQRIKDRLSPGSIVLMHLSGKTNTPEAIRILIPELKNDGYRFVKISELLMPKPKIFPYILDITPKNDTIKSILHKMKDSREYLMKFNTINKRNEMYVDRKFLIFNKNRFISRKNRK